LGVNAIARLLLTSLIALIMLFSFGFLIGGVVRSAEAANGIIAAILPILLMFSGIMIPLQILPRTLQRIADFSPLTFLGDAFRQDLVGGQGLHPITTDYAVMIAVSVVLTIVAIKTFQWDGPE
jgi:ABC-2 type transport system permease protein